MIECLKRIIREYQNLEPPDGLLPRRVAIGSLPGKVSVVTDVRGSGKTTLLRQRIAAHQENWNAILARIGYRKKCRTPDEVCRMRVRMRRILRRKRSGV